MPKLKSRELLDLALVLTISITFSLFSITVNFIDRLYKYFEAYTGLPVAEFLINMLFLCLAGLLWITYHRWRRSIKRIRELDDIISSISPDVLMVIDSDRKIIMCNTSVERLLGYKVDEIINQKTDVLYFDRRSNPSKKHEIHDVLGMVGFHKGLATGKKKNGDTIPLEIISAKLVDCEGVILQLRDISEREEATELIRCAYRELLQIFNTSVEGIRVIDRDHNMLLVNETFSSLSGIRENEMAGKKCYQVFDNHLCHTPSCMLTQILSGKDRIECDTENKRSDGTIVSCIATATPLRNSQGDLIGILEGFRDITDHKKAEKRALKQSFLLEANNRVFRETLWYETEEEVVHTCLMIAEELTGSKFGFIGEINKAGRFDTIALSDPGWGECRTPKTDAVKMIKDMKIIGIWGKVLKDKKTLIVNDPASHPDRVGIPEGHPKLTSFLGVPLRYMGETIGMIGLANKESGYDVTDQQAVESLSLVFVEVLNRKRASEELVKTKDHLDNIIESSLDCIVVTDEKGYIIRANKSFIKLLDYKEEEVLGKHIAELAPTTKGTYKSTTGEMIEINSDFFDGVKTMITKLSKESKVTNWESYLISKNKIVIPIEQNITYLYNKKEELVGSVGIIRNISERKKMIQQLLQSEKLRSFGELAGGVAHDFNNVLAAILGRVQLLKMQLKPPAGKEEKRKSMLEMKRSLEIIERASLDGAETVRRIQEFSRKRTDDKDFTPVDINELIDNALEFTRMRWKNEAESKGIKISIKKELSPLAPILASPSELREVFTNLINNAIDAMSKDGEIRLRSFMDDTIAVISIEDTGSGIPKNTKARIFDPFFTSKGVQSTGLGLSVSYGIINRHHGTISVDSVEGEGTTFTIKFPITKQTGKGEVQEEKIIPLKKKQKKARILVIEDEEDVRELLRDILTDAGHEVEVANNGSEGIEIFKKKNFDLVFTDLGMPVMSGWEVAEKVKSINGKVPVALITGWNVALDRSEMNNSGISLIIHKPFKMEQVLNLVQEGMIIRNQLKSV
jgi:PAS domain S-box-containing protein